MNRRPGASTRNTGAPTSGLSTKNEAMKKVILYALLFLLTGYASAREIPAGKQEKQNPESAKQSAYFTKYVWLGDAAPEEKPGLAARLVPNPQQLEWQRLELTAFIHFTVNTFTGQEWGTGKEDPAVFAPTDLDTDQWVETLRDAGFKLVMLTAKHHDGFCLWPTATTAHSVKNAAWMKGRGDVVKMLRASCDKYGMKMGLYVSPWDRNAESYGKGAAYDDFFTDQLTELLTGYGEVAEVWFDGANGSEADGKSQVYDWARYIETVRRLQPGAVTAIMGDDIRWIGNEAGKGRAEEWSASAMAPASVKLKNPAPAIAKLAADSPDLGSRSILDQAQELFWYPAEVDVSIRPGWFYHPEEDSQVKSLDELKQIYFTSVGCNAVLLLNIPPDRRGRFHAADVERLRDFGRWLRKTFSTNYVRQGGTTWTGAENESAEFDVAGGPFNVLLLGEDISKGQRVERFSVEISPDGSRWTPLASGTTIGNKRLIRFPAVESARKIRVTVERTRAEANISAVGLYYSE